MVPSKKKRQWAKPEIQGVPSEHPETFFVALDMAEYRHRFSWEAVGFPSLEVFKTYLDMVLGNQLWEALVEQGC